MAAHAFRAWLFDTEGMTVWNAQWYGGHHVLGYSMLFAPLAAWPGPAWVGALARSAPPPLSCRSPRPRRRRPARRRARRGCSPPVSSATSLIGRMPFTLGIALAVGAWLCAEQAGRAWRRARRRPRARLRAGQPGGGRVPGAGGGRARTAAGGRSRSAGRRLALPVAVGGATMVLCSPRAATTASSPPRSGRCWPSRSRPHRPARAQPARAPRRRPPLPRRAGRRVRVPTPFGQNALRLPVLLAGPLRARPRAPRPRAPRSRRWSSRSSTCSGCRRACGRRGAR